MSLSYAEFVASKRKRHGEFGIEPETIHESLGRTDLIVMRAYASRLVGQTRRMMAGAVACEEDGA